MDETPPHTELQAGPVAGKQAASNEPTPKPFKVGVLFVHGIGEQLQGDTLIRFAQPVIDWIDRWVTQPAQLDDIKGPKRGSSKLIDAALGPPSLRPGRAPHAVFEVDPGNPQENGPSLKTTWMLAESWWASEFHKPRFGELAGWLLTTGSWMILSHAGKTSRTRASRGLSRILRLNLAFGVSVLVALLVQVTVALLAVLAAIPIPQLRKSLSEVLLTLTGTLGDSFVLVSSPMQRAVAVSHLRRDMKWLAGRCDHVVVVAHSQGAAIAHGALQDSEPKNVSLFITVGSGLGKLEELQVMRERGRAYFLLSQIAVPLFSISLIFYPKMWALYHNSGDLAALAVLIYPPILIIAVLMLALKGADAYRDRIKKLSLQESRPDLTWIDYFSTADPVPNGPLGTPDAPVGGVKSRPVVNLMSFTADHSAYFQNRDEFIASVVADIDSTATTGLFTTRRELARCRLAGRRRRKRVRTLALLRWAGLAAIGVALFGLRNELPSFGRALYEALRDTPVFEAVAYFIRGGGVAGQKIISRLTGAEADTLQTFGLALLGASIPVGAVLVWNKLTFRLWRWWDNVSSARLFNPASWPSARSDRAFVKAIPIAAGLAPLLMACFALAWPNPRELGAHVLLVIHTGGKYIMGLLLLFGILSIVVGIFRSLYDRLRSWSQPK